MDDRKSGRSASSGQQTLKNKLAELRGEFQNLVVSRIYYLDCLWDASISHC